eukprot:6457566-Amphidinium_carterae.1
MVALCKLPLPMEENSLRGTEGLWSKYPDDSRNASGEAIRRDIQGSAGIRPVGSEADLDFRIHAPELACLCLVGRGSDAEREDPGGVQECSKRWRGPCARPWPCGKRWQGPCAQPRFAPQLDGAECVGASAQCEQQRRGRLDDGISPLTILWQSQVQVDEQLVRWVQRQLDENADWGIQRTLPRKVRKLLAKEQTSAEEGSKRMDVYPQWSQDAPEEDANSEDEKEALKVWEPSERQLQDLQIAHNNLGHPTSARMAQMLSNAGAHAVLVKYVREKWKCPTCQRRTKPEAPRPAAIPRSYEVNQVVGVDLMEIDSPVDPNSKLLLLNIIDWGSHYQQVIRVASKHSAAIWKGFCEAWLRILGPPTLLVVDQGTEFQRDFGESASSQGCLVVTVNTRTPWEAEQECPVTEEELNTMICLVTSQRNANMNRAGFSPHQRVFGISARTPTSLLCTDKFDPILTRSSPTEAFHKAESLRQTVARAWLELDSKSRLASALRGRNRRCAPPVAIGEAVYVWRQPQGQRGSWQGPGLVTMTSEKATWVSMRHLWKVPPEHIRPATPHESLGIEVLSKYMSSMQEELSSLDSRRGPKRYMDGMKEPGPHEEEDEEHRQEPDMGEPLVEAEQTIPEAEQTSRPGDQRSEPQDAEAVADAGSLDGEPEPMQIDEHAVVQTVPTAGESSVGTERIEESSAATERLEESPARMEPIEERTDIQAEAEIIRELLRNAPSLEERQRQGRENESRLTQAASDSSVATPVRRATTEHPESPERQRPRRQTFPFPTPADWHEAGAGNYVQQVAGSLAPNECLFGVTRTGRNAKTAVTTDKSLPRIRDCSRRITVDWLANQVLEDLDLRQLRAKRQDGQMHRRWPAHVTHTETFLVYARNSQTTTFIGAQVGIKDTLAKEINIWGLPPQQQQMFTSDSKRGRLKEWLSVKASGAVEIHQGLAAANIRANLKDRCVPSRWLD